jgi:hypothetical protein
MAKNVRAAIRLKLDLKLPPTAPSGRLWAGPGAGEVCSACDETITKQQTLYEWEVDGGAKMIMHMACYDVWKEERLRASRRLGNRRRKS